MNNKIAVLLSTFNGSKFLVEQIDSILNQKDVEVHLIIRDDGSTDETTSILKDYAQSTKNISLFLEANLGCEQSFKTLLTYANQIKCDYYAFCDQDDIWFPNKLADSIKAIQFIKDPALYCCNQMITDEHLRPIRLMIDETKYRKVLRQYEYNYFLNRHGCTMVWNSNLHKIIYSLCNNLSFIPGHDGWVNLVARCSGSVVIGKEPLMYYRIHGANTGGLERNVLRRLKKGIKLYLSHDCFRNEMAKHCLYLLEEKRTQGRGDAFVRKVAVYRDSFLKRLSLLFSMQIWQYGKVDSFVYALSVLLGKY